MWTIKTRFEPCAELDHIDVQIRAPERDAEVEALLDRISGRSPHQLTVTDADGVLCQIAEYAILSVSVNGKLLRLVTEDGVYTIRQTLQELEKVLDGDVFARVSRHELVNLNKVKKYDFTMAGELRLELVGGMETWASRRCVPAIRKRLNERGDTP